MSTNPARKPMKFGTVARMPDFQTIERVAVAAEEAGFDLFGVGDSQSLQGDTFVHLAMAARVTNRIRLSSCVTNIVTRHPAVTANAIATVDRVSGGRAVLGLSVGDSAVLNLGLRPARLAELEEGMVGIRALLQGKDATFGGRTARMKTAVREVPIYLAAEGPKSLGLAGEKADGVFITAGLEKGMIEMAEQWLADGLARAGRDRADVEVWHQARTVVDDDVASGLRRLRPALASVGHHALTERLEHKQVPAAMLPKLNDLKRRYDTANHVIPGDSPNARLIEELGLVDFLANRFAIVGNPEACADRVVELADYGVENLLVVVVDEDPAAVIRRFGDEVMPIVRERLG